MITMIAAAGQNNELGKDNDLVWHLPDDFKRFKQLTTGHYIIMGRKTFESFPKPLPNRTLNIIIVASVALQILTITVPGLRTMLRLVPLDAPVLALVAAALVVTVVGAEIWSRRAARREGN